MLHPRQFLQRLVSLSPLQLSSGVQKVNKKYSCAAVACIIRVVQSSTAKALRESERNHLRPLLTIVEEFDETDNVEMLFIQRTHRGGDRWSGDVAFPGGFLDLNESDTQGVVREVSEELGINLSDSTQYHWLGRLDHINLGSGRTITPHVYLYLGSIGPILKPEASEVANVEWVNIQVFLEKFVLPLDTRSLPVVELYSRAKRGPSLESSLLSTVSKMFSCSIIHFPAVSLPIYGNYETESHVNHHHESPLVQPESHWILWGMTFRFVSDLFKAVNNNKPYLVPKLPFWFDNTHFNASISFWHRILSTSMRSFHYSRGQLIILSFTSLFALYGTSMYGIWLGWSHIVS